MPTITDPRPVIYMAREEHVAVGQVIDALAAHPDLFARGPDIVEVVGCPNVDRRIATLTKMRVREHMTEVADYCRRRNDDCVKDRPADWLVGEVYGRSAYPEFRRLDYLCNAPQLLPDGRLLAQPGYAQIDGVGYLLEFDPGDFPNMIESPTRADARTCAEQLLGLFRDFPITTDVGRSVALALTLTIAARTILPRDANRPLFAVRGKRPADGKTLLAEAASRVGNGQVPAKSNLPNDNDETRRTLIALIRGGADVILWDNCARPVDRPAIDMALTCCGAVADRTVRTSEAPRIPYSAVMIATGNGLSVGSDTRRRTLWIDLDSGCERPELRSAFAHPELLEYIGSQRGKLYVAALTIVMAFMNEGCPSSGLPALGSFEPWSRQIRDAIVWCGYPDPVASQQSPASYEDPDVVMIRAIAEIGRPVVSADLFELAKSSPRLQRAIERFTQCRLDALSPQALSRGLARCRNMSAGGFVLYGERTNRGIRWSALPVEDGNDG